MLLTGATARRSPAAILSSRTARCCSRGTSARGTTTPSCSSYHQALHLFLVEGVPQAEVSSRLERSGTTVKNHVRRGKAKLIAYIHEEVWAYSSSQAEFAEELRWLGSFLPEPP